MPRPSSLLLVLSAQEITDFLPDSMAAQMRGAADQCFALDPTHLSKADFHRELARLNPEIIVTGWKTPELPPELPPRLKYVCHLAGSLKKLLSRRHLESGLWVSNWGGSISRVVAECALLLTLAALRRGGHWIPSMQRDGAWKDATTLTASLFGRRVGIHGFGQVARELTKLLRPFEVQLGIHAPETDPDLYAAHGARRIPTLAQLFADHDVVIELAPLIPATQGSVTEALLRSIPAGGVFVNVGRGAVVDEQALLRVAREGQLLIALDVYGVEPLPADAGLRRLSNVILLPHLGGPTTDRRRDAGALGLRNVAAYAAGRPIEALVTPQAFDSQSG